MRLWYHYKGNIWKVGEDATVLDEHENSRDGRAGVRAQLSCRE